MYNKLILLFLVVMMWANASVVALAQTEETETNVDQVWRLENDSTHVDPSFQEISVLPIPDHFKVIGENNNLRLYLDEQTLALKIENKLTGYIWDSVFMDIGEDEDINDIWRAFAQSSLTLEVMNAKGKVEKVSFPNSKTKLSLTMNTNGFEAFIQFTDIGIELNMNVTLEEEGIKIDIPASSIKETDDVYKIQSIFLYPFLGATKEQNIPGYLFIPDGSGALMRLEHRNTIATQPFIKRIYGTDIGMSGISNNIDTVVDSELISYPVYGVVHNANQNGIVSIIEQGSEYGEINAYPAGITTPYNWVTSRFILRETYFQPANKKGEGFSINQATPNVFDISVHHILLSGDESNYVGMAKKYREYLTNAGVLEQKEAKEQDIPMHVEFLASDKEKSLIGDKTVLMTTLDDMKTIIGDLNANGMNDLKVVIRGWNKGGATTGTLNHFPFQSEVGSKSEFKEFIQQYNGTQTEIFFYTDYLKGYDGIRGYSMLKDAAQTKAEQLLLDTNGFKPFNYLAPSSTEKFMINDKKQFDKYQIENIAVDTIGNHLYSNDASLTANTRLESVDIYNRSLAMLGDHLALYKPSAYLWKNVDEYFNIPMGSSNYLSTTDTVPFLQIVLKGSVNFYATPINFVSNPEDYLLNLIDYGAYPTVYLTEEDSITLLHTGSNWLYTSKYDIWKDQIIDMYNRLNKTLKLVEGEVIESREIVADNVVKVTYSNGLSFIINRSDKTYKNNQINVESKSFKVIGGNGYEVKGEN